MMYRPVRREREDHAGRKGAPRAAGEVAGKREAVDARPDDRAEPHEVVDQHRGHAGACAASFCAAAQAFSRSR